jgi:hypothetical protein
MTTTIPTTTGGTMEVPTSLLTYCKSRGIKEITDDVFKAWVTHEMKFWNLFDTDESFREGFVRATKMNLPQ